MGHIPHCMNLLARITQNKHTSGAAVVFVLATVVQKILPLWFPAHTDQLMATSNQIKEIAIGYGLLMGGDSKAVNNQTVVTTETPKT